jgi:NAD(P)H-flavin reductase/ferredoxin
MTDHRITILEADRVVDGRDTVSVLDACLNGGVSVRYNCRSGECGECMARLVSGRVKELPGADPAVFNDGHRQDGMILSCLCYPETDLEISVAMAAEGAPAIREFDAVVARVHRPVPSIAEITVRTETVVDYVAGQYFEWILPGIDPNRSYSAATRPGGAEITFHVRLYPDGQVSKRILRGEIASGDILTMKGPYGAFRWSDGDDRPTIMVAGGTGMAPIKALLEEAFALGTRRRILYVYGTRRSEDLYQTETMAEWTARFPNFTFIPALSDEPAQSGWQGARGLVTDILKREVRDAFGAEAYLCGPPPMIDAAIPMLEQMGLDRSDIHFDKFTPVG